MRHMMSAAFVTGLLHAAPGAMAQDAECGQPQLYERYGQIQALIAEKPERAELLESLADEVEAELGREPLPGEECKALDMLVEKLAAA